MAYKFGITFETLDPERRDSFLEDLIELIDQHRKGVDTSKIVLQHEVLMGSGGKRKITDTQEILPGMPIPDLSHFGQTPATPMELIEGFATRHGARVEFK